MTEIDSNVSLAGATRAQRIAIHTRNLGSFVRAGASTQPSSKPKVNTNFGATVRIAPETVDRPPLALDPLFRRFKGDSKAARIKDPRKRGNGPRIDAANFKANKRAV